MQSPLLPRIASGDASAIEQCLDRYGGLVWSLARRLSPSLADAEDATQEIFIELWRKADRFRPELASEATFVSVLARRRLIDRLRKLRRGTALQPIDESALEQAADPKPAPLELAEESARAANCLERLRSDERRVIELSVYQGLSQSRIAERLELPLGTVKTHAARGLSRLRDCMGVMTQERKGAIVP